MVDDVFCKGATKPRQEERVCNVHQCPIWCVQCFSYIAQNNASAAGLTPPNIRNYNRHSHHSSDFRIKNYELLLEIKPVRAFLKKEKASFHSPKRKKIN